MSDIDKRLEIATDILEKFCQKDEISILKWEYFKNNADVVVNALKQFQAEREEKERLERSIESALRDFDREDRLEGLITLKEALGGDRECSN